MAGIMAVLVRARREDPHHQHPQQARPQLQDPDRPLDGRPERARADRSRGTAIAIPEFANPVLDVGRLYPRESRTGKYARRTARLGTVGDKYRLGDKVISALEEPTRSVTACGPWRRLPRHVHRNQSECSRLAPRRVAARAPARLVVLPPRPRGQELDTQSALSSKTHARSALALLDAIYR